MLGEGRGTVWRKVESEGEGEGEDEGEGEGEGEGKVGTNCSVRGLVISHLITPPPHQHTDTPPHHRYPTPSS